ncbi:MAG: GWxTD domain-containing protein [Bacteroidetes bacterium]|nr:GWxTD domain-containing protein [Bacteroidota bacterium]
MNFIKKNIFLTISLIFVVSSCVTIYYSVADKNVSYLYNPTSTGLHPEFYIYHNSDSVSFLFYNIYRPELLFIKKEEKAKFKQAKILIQYQLYESLQKSEFIDSASFKLNVCENGLSNNYISYIPVKLATGKKGFIDISISDLNSEKQTSSLIEVDKTTNNSAQNYLVFDNVKKKPVFKNYFNKNTPFFIKSNRVKTKNLYVSYYKKKFGVPLPPFDSDPDDKIDFKPDSTWYVQNFDTVIFKFQNKGFYRFQKDTLSNEGLTLFNYGDDYPRVQSAEKLFEPLQYLTSSREYKKLNAYNNPKIAVDSLWILATGNVDRARELIRIYYGRVQLANYYFPSLSEGWKTDRGMIYVVYGIPTMIYKNDSIERWIYGKKAKTMSMDFTFEKTENPFSNNYYILNRSDVYDDSWFKAVNTWRSGHVFSIAK